MNQSNTADYIESENDILNRDVVNLRAKVKELYATLSNLNQEVDELEQELENAQDEYDQLQGEYDALEEEQPDWPGRPRPAGCSGSRARTRCAVSMVREYLGSENLDDSIQKFNLYRKLDDLEKELG